MWVRVERSDPVLTADTAPFTDSLSTDGRGTVSLLVGAAGPPGLGLPRPGVPPQPAQRGGPPAHSTHHRCWLSIPGPPQPHTVSAQLALLSMDSHVSGEDRACGWRRRAHQLGPRRPAPRLSQHVGLRDLLCPPTPHTCGGRSQEHTRGAGTCSPSLHCPPRGNPPCVSVPWSRLCACALSPRGGLAGAHAAQGSDHRLFPSI